MEEWPTTWLFLHLTSLMAGVWVCLVPRQSGGLVPRVAGSPDGDRGLCAPGSA